MRPQCDPHAPMRNRKTHAATIWFLRKLVASRPGASAGAKLQQERPQCSANRGRRIFLDEMDALDGDFALVEPTAADVASAAGEQRARIGVDEQLRNLRAREP